MSLGFKIKMFKMPNFLRAKAGIHEVEHEVKKRAEIDPKGMREAEKIVEEMKKQCPAAVQAYLIELSQIWNDMKELPNNDERQALSDRAFTLAHQIKDMAAMGGATLTAYFAESLRDYIGETELNLKAQQVIIQAHIDAMNTIEKHGVQDAQSPLAEELKTMVKIAVEKYK